MVKNNGQHQSHPPMGAQLKACYFHNIDTTNDLLTVPFYWLLAQVMYSLNLFEQVENPCVFYWITAPRLYGDRLLGNEC